MSQHIGFEQRSRCIYDSRNCGNEPIYYLLMGCLNQHLSEGAICETHARVWVAHQRDHDLSCEDCGLHIEEYLILTASMLT